MVLPSQILKKILQRVLEPFLVGFTTKDLSLNFLSGKAALRDVEVNVDAINEKINENPGTPLRFTRVYVSQLSVQATVSKIKSRPIKILIDEVIMEMEEPSVVLPPRHGAQPPGPPGPLDAPHRYALGDRIGDGIFVHIKRVLIVIRLKGLLKDAPIGSWTPPCLVVELFGVSINSTDEHGREYLDLAALWKAVNYKMPEVMVYKQVKIERMVIKLIPTSPKVFKVDVKLRGPLPKVPGEAVLLDQSPSPVSVNITMRKRFRDSAMLGLMVHVEAQSLLIDLLHSAGDGMMAHVLISLLQCVSRQGDIAWVDESFRARLWAAVDKGELPLAKVYGAQGKKKGDTKKSFFTVVETEPSSLSQLKEELLEEDDDMELADDSAHSETSRLRDKDKDGKVPPPPPRMAIGVDIDHLTLLIGSSGLDGGLRIEIRGIQVDQLGNVKLPLECLNSSATIIEAAKQDQDQNKPYMDIVQVRVSDLRVEALHPATGDPIATLLYTQRDLTKPVVGGATPLRFLRRGVERGFDPALDVTVSRGRRGDFNPLLAQKKVFGHAVGVMIIVPKGAKGMAFPKISSKMQIDISATLSVLVDLPRVSLLPDYAASMVDARWFTGVGWPLDEAKGAETPLMLTSRIEPMQQPAPSCMVIRLRGGVKVALPSPEDIPTLPSLTIYVKTLSAVKDHTKRRYCLDSLPLPNQLPTTDDEYEDPPLLPDRWNVEMEGLKVNLGSLDSSSSTSPDVSQLDLVSIAKLTAIISLDLHTKRRFRAPSFKRQHSIDSMLAVQRSTFNRVSPDVDGGWSGEAKGIAPGLDMSYVTRAVEGTSFNVSADVGAVVISADLLALVAASQLLVHSGKSIVLASEFVSSMLLDKSAGTTANSMSRLSEVATLIPEDIAQRPLAAMTVRVKVSEFQLAVPSPTQGVCLAVSVGMLRAQLVMKQDDKSPQDIIVDTVVAVIENAVVSTPEQNDYALLVLKGLHGFGHVDWMNLKADGEVEGEGLACIVDSTKLVGILSALARRWGTTRVCVVGCDRTNCLFGDEVSLVEFIQTPMIYLDMMGNISEEDDNESVTSIPVAAEAEGTLSALLPSIGIELAGRMADVEVQLLPVPGSDRWTVLRLNEVEASVELDSMYKVDGERAIAAAGATTLAVAHRAPEDQEDEKEGVSSWTSFNTYDGDDDQLISPLRLDATVSISNTLILMKDILDGVALKCNIQPVLDTMPSHMEDFPVEMDNAAEDRLSIALRDTSLRESVRSSNEVLDEPRPSIGAALAAAGMQRIVERSISIPPQVVQRKSVPLKRLSMKPSSTVSLRLAAGTVTRLQALFEHQLNALQSLLTVLVTHGWLSPETIPIIATDAPVVNTNTTTPAASTHSEKGREQQVADDLVALGKTMQEARAAADKLGEEVKIRARDRMERQKELGQLRVGGSETASFDSKNKLKSDSLISMSSSIVGGSMHGPSSVHGDAASEDNEEWALERLRDIQRLLATAQSLQEHTKATMATQLSELSRKQIELEERERALQTRLLASESSEANLKKELSRVERQLESSEARRVTDEQHHDSTVQKLQNKLKEALHSGMKLDEGSVLGGSLSPVPPVPASTARQGSSRSVLGKWMSKTPN